MVRITSPDIEYRVKISHFERWLAAACRSPAEMSRKSRLRDVIEL